MILRVELRHATLTLSIRQPWRTKSCYPNASVHIMCRFIKKKDTSAYGNANMIDVTN